MSCLWRFWELLRKPLLCITNYWSAQGTLRVLCQSFRIDVHLQTGFETCTLFACRFQIGFKNQRVAGCRESGLYIKFGYRLGSGFKIASSLEILLFLHRNSKPLNRLVDPRNRSGQVCEYSESHQDWLDMETNICKLLKMCKQSLVPNMDVCYLVQFIVIYVFWIWCVLKYMTWMLHDCTPMMILSAGLLILEIDLQIPSCLLNLF